RAEQRQAQEEVWSAHTAWPRTVARPLYQRLNQLLEERGFDEFVEGQCERFYAEAMGRPSLVPGRYFRLLLIGYFEGIEGERGIAWRAADSLALLSFLGVGLDEQPPDHSTISRTRRLIDVETHQAVFRWVLEVLAEKGLLKGKTIGIDATTLKSGAAGGGGRAGGDAGDPESSLETWPQPGVHSAEVACATNTAKCANGYRGKARGERSSTRDITATTRGRRWWKRKCERISQSRI